MSTEQQLLNKWRKLPIDQQQEVLQFIESLHQQKLSQKSELGERLRSLRAKIVAQQEPLLNLEQIEQEVINRRGGLKNIDE